MGGTRFAGRTRFVTRHAGALEWARRLGVDAEVVAHLDPADLQAGDVVMGTLPIQLAAEVCRRGGRYFHLVIDLPADLRGVSLTADDMQRLGASLQEYRVEYLGAAAKPETEPDAG
ncbi:MAG: CRISPR-associated protein Csx16 [Thalassobaculum sp.]|uniref:CRISPR-associated protein Csx16 n=1 Tax=Thalassobaculum sp. TaxID=2022740 RepID=UPI0032EF74E2